MKQLKWRSHDLMIQLDSCVCSVLTIQGGLLSALGSLALMIWLASTPHSPQTERKRLAILAGFAFLTGMSIMTMRTVLTLMT